MVPIKSQGLDPTAFSPVADVPKPAAKPVAAIASEPFADARADKPRAVTVREAPTAVGEVRQHERSHLFGTSRECVAPQEVASGGRNGRPGKSSELVRQSGTVYPHHKSLRSGVWWKRVGTVLQCPRM